MASSGIKKRWHWLRARFHRLLADAHRHFGNQHGNLDDHWAAIENYTRAIVLDPAYSLAYYNRGILYWREVGNTYRAVQDLTQVLELDPACAEAYFNRGVAHRMRNENDQAIADFEHYLSWGQDAFWLDSAQRQLQELHSLTNGTDEP
jgi:tetratricopeptide (TPR) repeat protein